jgi:hypothetical protein
LYASPAAATKANMLFRRPVRVFAGPQTLIAALPPYRKAADLDATRDTGSCRKSRRYRYLARFTRKGFSISLNWWSRRSRMTGPGQGG